MRNEPLSQSVALGPIAWMAHDLKTMPNLYDLHTCICLADTIVVSLSYIVEQVIEQFLYYPEAETPSQCFPGHFAYSLSCVPSDLSDV